MSEGLETARLCCSSGWRPKPRLVRCKVTRPTGQAGSFKRKFQSRLLLKTGFDRVSIRPRARLCFALTSNRCLSSVTCDVQTCDEFFSFR